MTPPILSSRENSLFKLVRKLTASSRERRKSGKAVLDGIHLITAYQQALGLPELIIVAESAGRTPEIAAYLRDLPRGKLATFSDALFRELSTVEVPTGVMALIPIPRHREGRHSECCALLEDIQDPGNLGSILRSAAAAGVSPVYLSRHCADPWSPKVLRAGMGAHFATEIVERADLSQIASQFRGKVLATVLRADKTLYEADLSIPVAFIIGNEGAGISPGLLQVAHETVTIPMPGRMESLNAAAAAAVCFFERVRQTRSLALDRDQ